MTLIDAYLHHVSKMTLLLTGLGCLPRSTEALCDIPLPGTRQVCGLSQLV